MRNDSGIEVSRISIDIPEKQIRRSDISLNISPKKASDSLLCPEVESDRVFDTLRSGGSMRENIRDEYDWTEILDENEVALVFELGYVPRDVGANDLNRGDFTIDYGRNAYPIEDESKNAPANPIGTETDWEVLAYPSDSGEITSDEIWEPQGHILTAMSDQIAFVVPEDMFRGDISCDSELFTFYLRVEIE